MLTWMFHSAWMLACRSEAMRFDAATHCVADTQSDLLFRILKQNSQTVFGRRHALAGIQSVEQFQEKIPLSQYQDYQDDINRISGGQSGVLTQEPVDLLEPTSGSTGGEKLIPVTLQLRRDFQRAISPWLYDLLKNRPGLRHGRSYWSVSPAMVQNRVTTGGIRIGFNDDAEYLNWPQEQMLRHLLAVPSAVSRIQDLQNFRLTTLRHLLAAEDLTLISVWSPTFLIELVHTIQSREELLLTDHPQISRRRNIQTKQVLRSHASWSEKLHKLWPRLGLISCWADATAARYIPELRDYFPHVEIQPKGLLATECCVSFPLLDHNGAALAVRSHFFEFQEVNSQAVYLAHQLQVGKHYYVIITTSGGLYRYQLRDEIEVCGHYRQCPLIRFVGKADGISDMVGEKLAEIHCREVIEHVLAQHQLHPAFIMMVPAFDVPRHYSLYLQDDSLIKNSALVEQIRQSVDSGLKKNPYYAQALSLGQLAPLAVCIFKPNAIHGYQLYEQACLQRGIRLGNIKPVMMDKWDGWPAVFDSHCV